MKLEPIELDYLGINDVTIRRNLSEDELIKIALEEEGAKQNQTGALMVNTGQFTGRSPKDRFIVEDENTKGSVDWGKINQPISTSHFNQIYKRVLEYLKGKTLYVRDVYACADSDYKLKVRVINELAWQNLFVRNMFIECSNDCLLNFVADWHVIAVPGFLAKPESEGTRQGNFSIINFDQRIILIGGSAYTGEIKKGVFSVLNYLLPKKEAVLSMHCSANKGKDGDTAIFFGLSGTGKTTLSADPDRFLIGDDEHGWSEKGIFNFEGGCYAKTINLSKEGEPEIYNAIKKGALVENMKYKPGTNELDFSNDEITPNIRVSYPIEHIEGAVLPSKGNHPSNIFMLTFDAFGVLPPISKLNEAQAMYQFITGFTSKVAGTEEGVKEPQGTFSACYGAPFMPLHPMEYARMLGDKMRMHNTNVWLVNTGFIGGGYGKGSRIKLQYTRALIEAALDGTLQKQSFEEMPVFGFQIPKNCPNVPHEILNPREQWEDQTAYDEKLNYLASAFLNNFKQYEDKASEEVIAASPKIAEAV